MISTGRTGSLSSRGKIFPDFTHFLRQSNFRSMYAGAKGIS
nr:MAG TPA: hypothetical protein [Bacteriophage sp.]